jgi:hypothetical protein
LVGSVAKSLALSYLLPSGILLHQMAIRQSEELPPSFEVSGRVVLTGDEARRSAAELGIEVLDSASLDVKLALSPDKCALQIQSPRPVTVVDDRGQVSGGNLPWATQLVRLACLPFVFRGEQAGDRIEAALKAAGSNFEESALTFEEGAVSYVLGAGEAGTGPAGLVIKKRDLVPLRAWAQEGNARLEVSFRGYREAFHQGGFPTLIELRANGILVARFTVS